MSASHQADLHQAEFPSAIKTWNDPGFQSVMSTDDELHADNNPAVVAPWTGSCSFVSPAIDDVEIISIPISRHLEPNNRQFSRVPMTSKQNFGTLVVNRRTYQCRLVEISIGGFGILVVDPADFRNGTTGSLRVNGLNYIVSVSRVEKRSEGSFVGLKQIEEVLDHRHGLPGQPRASITWMLAGLSIALIGVLVWLLGKSA